MTTGLAARGVAKRFAGLTALDGVDLDVPPGQVTGLIGPNGAGKTTLFGCLSGLLRPDRGRVLLAGTDVTRLTSDQRARRGLARTFQRLAVFDQLTVADNLRVAAEAAHPVSLLHELVRVRHPGEPAVAERIESVLDQVGLCQVRDRVAATLPTGILRLVEVARALCTRPTVLLLDEPASGLDDEETAVLRQVLTDVSRDGIAVLLVEHDLELVLEVSARVYVLDQGRLLATGTPGAIRADESVRAAYLGPRTAAG